MAGLLALSCCTPRIEQAPPSPELEQALSLLECPPQTVAGDGKRYGVRDCADFESHQWGGSDRGGVGFRYSSTHGSALETVAVQYVSRDGIDTFFTEKDVDPGAHAFQIRLTKEGGEEVVIPVMRSPGNPALSVWLSDFLEPHYDRGPAYVYAGDIPAGVMIAWRPECNLFGVSKPPHTDPWRITLYRVKDIEEYRAKRLGFEDLGELNVTRDAAGKCTVSGADTISRAGLSPDEFDGEICEWLDDASAGVTHHVSDC